MHKGAGFVDVPVRILDDVCVSVIVMLDYDIPPTGSD
jgi:hypothetical protein